MSGDLYNACEKLRAELKAIKFARIPSEKEFLEENPAIFLQILHYTLVDFSPLISEYLVQHDFELYSKNDMRFMESVFKFMIKELSMKPGININQFFSQAYAESKCNFCVALIQRIKTLRDEIDPQRKKPKVKNMNEQRYPSKLPGSKYIEEKENIDDNIAIQRDKLNKKKNCPIQEIFTQGLKEEDEIEQVPKFQMIPHPEQSIYQREIATTHQIPEKEELTEPKITKKSSKPQESNNQMKDILKMILDINTTISTMSKKFEEFQGNVETWMNNTNARMILLENNYKIIKSSQSLNNKSTSLEPSE